ncbi:hypothetical protein ACFEID_002011 [Neisseria gonorrhoeae]|nr:hypothetical protein [Neisseria gonorrhoeae]WLF12410.1 hypothetical protein Q6379_06125 [Neisseria gonorrhoeae]
MPSESLSECEACPQGAASVVVRIGTAFSFPPIIGALNNFV